LTGLFLSRFFARLARGFLIVGFLIIGFGFLAGFTFSALLTLFASFLADGVTQADAGFVSAFFAAIVRFGAVVALLIAAGFIHAV